MAFAPIQRDLAVGPAVLSAALLFLPGLIAALVEPWLFVLADRYPRRRFITGGLALYAVGLGGMCLATGSWTAMAGVTLAWVGSGLAVTLAQATLADSQPNERERAMSRWALAGELGDLAAPALLGTLAYWGLSWRAGGLIVAGLLVGWALWLGTLSLPSRSYESESDADAESESDAESENRSPSSDAESENRSPSSDSEHREPSSEAREPSADTVLGALRVALGNRALMGWLAVAALCELLDELVVVFGVLHLRDAFGFDGTTRAWVIGAGVAGAMVGAALTERLVARVGATRLLGLAGLCCAPTYVAWLFASSPRLSAALFALVGLSVAPMYPLAIARAYAALPGRSGTVHAAGHAFSPLLLALPVALGLMAEHFGTLWALVPLLAQPVVVGLVAWRR